MKWGYIRHTLLRPLATSDPRHGTIQNSLRFMNQFFKWSSAQSYCFVCAFGLALLLSNFALLHSFRGGEIFGYSL